jgi:hypothetical protein
MPKVESTAERSISSDADLYIQLAPQIPVRTPDFGGHHTEFNASHIHNSLELLVVADS